MIQIIFCHLKLNVNVNDKLRSTYLTRKNQGVPKLSPEHLVVGHNLGTIGVPVFVSPSKVSV